MTSDKPISAPTSNDRLESAAMDLADRIDDIASRMKSTEGFRALMMREGKQAPHTRFTDHVKMDYLMALAATGRKGDSANFAGVTLRTVQMHRNDDEEFRELEQVAEEAYRDRVRAAIDEEGIEGALQPIILRDSEGGQFIEGWRRVRNPRILELAAKLHLPEFRERVEVSGDIGVKVGVLAVTAPPADASAWSERHGLNRKKVENVGQHSPEAPGSATLQGETIPQPESRNDAKSDDSVRDGGDERREV